MTSPTGRNPDNKPRIQNIPLRTRAAQTVANFANIFGMSTKKFAAALQLPEALLFGVYDRKDFAPVPQAGPFFRVYTHDVMQAEFGTRDVGGWGVHQTRILRPTPMLHALPPLVKARRRNMVWCAPKLVLDEVSKQLSWENERYRDRYERELLAHVERTMTGTTTFDVGEWSRSFTRRAFVDDMRRPMGVDYARLETDFTAAVFGKLMPDQKTAEVTCIINKPRCGPPTKFTF